MTETPHDGGPAFPQSDLSGYGIGPAERSNGGMTLRDWFAGQAIMGLCADPSNHELFDSHDDAAKSAYFIADAMIAARGGN
jgi:hypothetical protein